MRKNFIFKILLIYNDLNQLILIFHNIEGSLSYKKLWNFNSGKEIILLIKRLKDLLLLKHKFNNSFILFKL